MLYLKGFLNVPHLNLKVITPWIDIKTPYFEVNKV